MIIKFQIAHGHDADVADFVNFRPYQPKTKGLEATRRSPTAGGHTDEGFFVRFIFGSLSEAEFQQMLLDADVFISDYADVTVAMQDQNMAWFYANGVAHKPEAPERRGMFLANVPLLITDIYMAETI